MRKILSVLGALLALSLTVPAGAVPPAVGALTAAQDDRTAFVDPFIGSFAPGFTNPGPVLPHGMVGLGPDTVEGPLNYGGYYINNTMVSGFSHTHMSAGVFHGGHIPIMPVVGPVDTSVTMHPAGAPVPGYASPFERAAETAEPGYYSTTLARYGVTAELTATPRTGLHRYTFPTGSAISERHVVIDIGRTLKGLYGGEYERRNDNLFVGAVHTDVSGPMPVFFALEVDGAMNWSRLDGSPVGIGQSHSSEDRLGLIGTPHVDNPNPVLQVRVGISYTDAEGALANLRAEQPHFDFEATRQKADDAWEEALGRIEVSGGTLTDRIRFHTAMYHAQLFPNVHSDVDGRYRGPDQKIHTDIQRPHYSQFSLWDSYNGQSALQAVINPDAYRDMLHSLADFADQGGVLPRWQLGPNNPGYMSGDPVIPFIGEGWCRGLVDDDPELARRLMAEMRELLDRRPAELAGLGHLSTPHAPMWAQFDAGGRNAGTTLEYGIADFSLALMDDDADLAARSLYHQTLMDPQTGFIRPKNDQGVFLPEFSPENGYGFQEGTSWQYSWLAAHDYGGLMDGMAASDHDLGPEEKLDVFFNLPSTVAPSLWPKIQNQITAFGVLYFGNQYAPGNEHDLQAPFAYNWLGVPWKTQAATRAAISTYTATYDGLPGNDDLGALSGWLVWSMLGLHPAVPGAPAYTVASPMFPQAIIHRPGNGDLTIQSEGTSAVNKHIQDASIDSTWILETDVAGETILSFDMGPTPSSWGAGSPPPSASTDPLSAWGCDG